MPQETINKLLEHIDTSVGKFVSSLPAIQRKTFDKVLLLVKDLELDALGNIKNNIANIRLIGKIKKQLGDVILSTPYLKNVSEFVTIFDKVQEVNNSYLSSVFNDFKPRKVLEEIKKVNISATVESLTEAGVGNGMTSQITNVLRANITSGGSYADLIDVLKGQIVGTTEKAGYMVSESQKIVIDAVHQYNAQYIKSVTDDLGLVWFQYIGSLIKTSRDFCKALTSKRYFHISEVPDLLRGQIDGVKVALNKNGLPNGMYDNENKDNFFVYRGGHKCGHQIYPVATVSVPASVRAKFVEV